MPGVTPPCYNRPPRAEGQWMFTGVIALREIPGLEGLGLGEAAYRWKDVYRWVPAFSADRCATHDGRGIGPNGESYPDAHGWDCAGCRWHPNPAPEWLQAKYAEIQKRIDDNRREVEAYGQRVGQWYDRTMEFAELIIGHPPCESWAVTKLPEEDDYTWPPEVQAAMAVDKPVDNPWVIPRPMTFGEWEQGVEASLEAQGCTKTGDSGSILFGGGRRAGKATWFKAAWHRRLSDSLCADLGITAPYRNRA